MVIRRGPSQVIYHLFFDKKVPGGLMHFALDPMSTPVLIRMHSNGASQVKTKAT